MRADYNSALCRTHANALTGILHGLGVLLAPAIAKANGQSTSELPHEESATEKSVHEASPHDRDINSTSANARETRVRGTIGSPKTLIQ